MMTGLLNAKHFYTGFSRLSAVRVGLLAALLLLGLGLLGANPVAAHDRLEIGDYVVIAGWEHEPVIVGERNSIIFRVTEGDDSIAGLEGSLEAEVLYAGRIFRANMLPADAEGWYAISLLPTVRGQYTLRLVGSIEALEIDELLEPEEVLPVSVLAFPESPPSASELQIALDEQTQQLQTTTMLAIIAIVLAALGLLTAALTLLRRRPTR